MDHRAHSSLENEIFNACRRENKLNWETPTHRQIERLLNDKKISNLTEALKTSEVYDYVLGDRNAPLYIHNSSFLTIFKF